MSIHLEFEIAFKSDFHIGAGHGLGQQVDSALLRDADHVPVIRGTVITGLLRDSLLNLLSLPLLAEYRRCEASGLKTEHEHGFCGQFSTGDEGDCPVCAIFGSPRRIKHWRISSARPADLLAPQQPDPRWQPGEAAAQTTTRVRVNPLTRRAEENKLFTREEGDGSVRFRFTADCLGEDEATWQEAEWLVAAARFLHNLGASKRRGRGECEVRLVGGASEAELLDRFEKRLKNEKVQAKEFASSQEPERLVLPANPSQHTYRLQVLVRTDEPLLIARRAEAGNQFETLEGIPGGTLRGGLAWQVAQRAGAKIADQSSAEYANFVTLFFRDAVRFSSLLPVQVSRDDAEQGYPTIPAPRDFLTCKLHPGYAERSLDVGHGVWSKLHDPSLQDECPLCAAGDPSRNIPKAKVKLETVNGFLPLNRGGLTTRFRPQQTVEMHIQLEPETGRVRTNALFGYIALEPGQYFVGEITCADAATWQTLQTMAGLTSLGAVQELRLGKAGRRGYGKCSMVVQQTTRSPWLGPDVDKRVPNTDNVSLLLLTDAIITDPWGRFERGFEGDWLKRELGLPASATITVDADRRFSATRPVDAFNAKLGLPRTRDVVLVAGSSVRLAISGITIDELRQKLTAAEAAGIGLRRDEGFGRVAFNHPIFEKLATWQSLPLDISAVVLGDQLASHEQMRLAQFERVWRAKLDDLWGADKRFEHEPFEATARLLHVSRATSRQAVGQELQTMGKMDALLPEQIKGRDKKNFYKQGDGQSGMKRIYDPETAQTEDLLGELAKLIAEQGVSDSLKPAFWRRGLQVLADRIAEPARRKAKERR